MADVSRLYCYPRIALWRLARGQDALDALKHVATRVPDWLPTWLILGRAGGTAEAGLARPDLDHAMAADISGVITDSRRSAAEGDDAGVEAYSDELIDLLMEVEE